MSIVNLPRRPDWMVGEMGLSAPGDLSRLSRTFEPDVAALLLVAPAHLQFFSSVDAIAEAKAEILEGLRAGGTFVANADDRAGRVDRRALRRARSSASARLLRRASLRAESRRRGPAAVPPEDAAREKPTFACPCPVRTRSRTSWPPRPSRSSSALSPSDCAEAAAELRPAAHRGEWRRHASGARLYDDTYNANPASMRAALETLASVPASRRIAVLGDMLELGPEEERLHREIGRQVAGRADLLVAVGERARWIGEGAIDGRAARATARASGARQPRRPPRCSRGVLEAGDVVHPQGIARDRPGPHRRGPRRAGRRVGGALTCSTGCSIRSRRSSRPSTSFATSLSAPRWRR